MIRKIVLGGILVTAALLGSGHQYNAFACNKTDGCIFDVIREDNDMRRDGRAEKAMEAGRENVEAFRALQAAQQKGTTRQGSAKR
ncbi:hypothetical protein [Bosea beijingensis]